MKKHRQRYVGIILLFFFSNSSFAQNTFNLSFGFPKINWDYSGNLDGLRTIYRNGWSITASGLKIQDNGLIYGFDLGVNRYGNGFQFGNMRFDIKEIHHFSLLPFIGYEHKIQGTKFSVRTNLGFGLGIVPQENKIYQNDQSFQTRRIERKDANGNSYSEPLYDLTFSGSQEVKNRLFPLLKPNMELHYSVGENSSVFMKGTMGITFMDDIIVRDFPDVVLEGENYNVNHSSNLNYTAVEFGYSRKLK